MKIFFVSFIAALLFAYVTITSAAMNNISSSPLEYQIKQTIPNNELNITATHEVIRKFNHILHNQSEREDLRNTFWRLKYYQDFILTALKNKGLPADLIFIPVVESQYHIHRIKNNSRLPAGIWQMVPSTARKYGLMVNKMRDDRLNPQLETTAALNYIKDLYAKFQDWPLVLVAYELGDGEAERLMRVVHSRDAWVLARSSEAPSILKHHLALFDTAVIMGHSPFFSDRDAVRRGGQIFGKQRLKNVVAEIFIALINIKYRL